MKKIHCKICGSDLHYQTFCHLKKKKWLKTESKTAKTRRVAMQIKWEKLNPPDADGYWDCYLQISEKCLRRVSKYTMTKEHVQPRVKRPDLKYSVDNIRPACSWCNKLKGSQSLEQLAVIYPHLKKYCV